MRLSALFLCTLILATLAPPADAGVLARPGGAVVFAFDDGCASAMDGAAMLEARGWRGTFYVLTGRPPSDVCQQQLTRDQIAQLAARGHDVEGHTVSHPHLATLAPDALRHELRTSQADLSTLVGRKVAHFAYPYGEAGPRVEAATAESYQTGRLYYSRIDAMPLDVRNPYHLPAIGILARTTVGEALAAVDRAVRADATLIIVLHDLRKDPEPYDTTPAFLAAFLDRVAQMGVPVLTLAEAMGSSSGVRFTPKAGNEWWVQVSLAGPEAGHVARVESRDTGGPWVVLTKRSWGDWAASYRVETGNSVEYRATLRDGRVVATCAYEHPAPRCLGSTGSQLPPPGGFTARFENVRGNAWWVETDVSTAGGTLAGVDARNDGGTWIPLTKQSWGSWAKNLRAGSVVEFRARSVDGMEAISARYAWPPQ